MIVPKLYIMVNIVSQLLFFKTVLFSIVEISSLRCCVTDHNMRDAGLLYNQRVYSSTQYIFVNIVHWLDFL